MWSLSDMGSSEGEGELPSGSLCATCWLLRITRVDFAPASGDGGGPLQVKSSPVTPGCSAGFLRHCFLASRWNLGLSGLLGGGGAALGESLAPVRVCLAAGWYFFFGTGTRGLGVTVMCSSSVKCSVS